MQNDKKLGWLTPSDLGWIDWNELTMDQLADYLENKYMFQSSGDAFAVMRMVDFYREHKDLLKNDRNTDKEI